MALGERSISRGNTATSLAASPLSSAKRPVQIKCVQQTGLDFRFGLLLDMEMQVAN